METGKAETYTVYLLYRPPSAGPSSKTELSELLRSAEKNSLLIGDFNLPGINWSSRTVSGEDELFVTTMHDHLVSQLIDFPTHVKGNYLDLIVTNMPERINDICDVRRLGKSDHCMLLLSLTIPSRGVNLKKIVTNWKKPTGMESAME